MKRKLFCLSLFFIGFELFEEFATQLRFFVRHEPMFTWLQSKKIVYIVFSNMGIFFLYSALTFIIFEFFFRSNKRKAILLFIISVFLVISLRYIIQEILFWRLFHFHNYEVDNLLFYFVDNLYFAVGYSGFALVYFFVLNDRKRLHDVSLLQLQNKESQLSFLRAQINPHFLFNSLNNIYSMVNAKSEQALQTIASLSEILRYMLYETSGYVSLEKEILCIKKYISLHQSRFPEIIIKQELEGSYGHISVPSLLLIPFVENAFKHGDFKHSGEHLYVALAVKQETLFFHIENKTGFFRKKTERGIGLSNIQNRLSLLYPARHSLLIRESDGIFIVDLQIHLK